MTDRANYDLILHAVRELGTRVNLFPTRADVVAAVREGLDDHVMRCPLYQGALRRGADEITGVHDVSAYRSQASMEITRPSIPSRMAARVPKWALWIAAMVGTAIASAITTMAAQ